MRYDRTTGVDISFAVEKVFPPRSRTGFGPRFRFLDPGVNEFQVIEDRRRACYRYFASVGEIGRRAPHLLQNCDEPVARVPQDEQRIASHGCTEAGAAPTRLGR